MATQLGKPMRWRALALGAFVACCCSAFGLVRLAAAADDAKSRATASDDATAPDPAFDQVIQANMKQMMSDGKQTFRYATFGDESWWGGTLGLHRAIEGSRFGGVGPGVSPATALAVGLKVDVDSLPPQLVAAIKNGKVDLNDPATTLGLLQLNAVVGVTGFCDSQGSLSSVGIQCALCHSSVDNSLAPGIGHRLDGWANRDLNVGAIVALSPNLTPIATLLGVDVPTVLKVLNSWGPGASMPSSSSTAKRFVPMGLRQRC